MTGEKIGYENINLPSKEYVTYNLNQGVYKGHFYYGKLIEREDQLLEMIIFDDRSSAVNWEKCLVEKIVKTKTGKEKKVREAYGTNQIKEMELNYINPLILQKSCWSNCSINQFLKPSVVSEGNVGVTIDGRKNGYNIYNIAESSSYNIYNIEKKDIITPYTPYPSLTTQLHQKPDKKQLFKAIIEIQEHFMDVVDRRALLLGASFVIASYCYTLFDSIGYLFFNSDKDSGKTKYANLLGLMGFHTINSTNPSDSALFRITSLGMGLMIIDDFENLPVEKKNALNQILKIGYRRGGFVIRVEKIKETFTPKVFDCYCPKIVTNTTSLEPVTLSRCIPIHLMKTVTEKGKLYPNESEGFWQIVRDACHLLVLGNWREIKRVYDGYECSVLNNRDLELVKGILAICKFVDVALHEQLLQFVVQCFRDRETVDMTGTWDYELYDSLRGIAGEGGWLSTSVICEHLRGVLLSADQCDDAKDYKAKTGKSLPGVRWVGNRLSRIPSFRKRRVGAGVEYWLSSRLVEDYMKIKGFYVEEAGKE